MQQQKNRSRAATTLDSSDWQILNDANSLGFAGYDTLETATEVLRYRKVIGKGKELYQLVLAQTPFMPKAAVRLAIPANSYFPMRKLRL